MSTARVWWWLLLSTLLLVGLPGLALADTALDHGAGALERGPAPLGIRLEFVLFALTLLGVALFHHHTLYVALGGLAAVLTLKLTLVENFDLLARVHHEWPIILNLLGLLVGFAILAKHFEESRIPQWLPAILPDDWKGGLVLLGIVFVLSSFLDNIAAAMIGGEMARVLYKNRVHVGFLAAIVAASNAGGAGSVVGDTTTTMIWLAGISPLEVAEAALGAAAAIAVCGSLAAWQQQRFQPIVKDAPVGLTIDWARLVIVGLVLAGAIGANLAWGVPAAGVWAAILLGIPLRRPDWHVIPGALKGAAFLLALVSCAALMPVDTLPTPSWGTTLGLGFVSAVFDNIPLTKLAIAQGGYDWGFLAYAVGFGGSMMWFGSSAGVALSTIFPQTRSTGRWLRFGWHVIPAYVVGFLTMLLVVGWHVPGTPTASGQPAAAVGTAQVGSVAAPGRTRPHH